MFRKYIYLFGQYLRNPSLKKNYTFLKKSEKWSLEELETYQLKKIKNLLISAYKHSEFYKNKFNELNIDVYSITTLADFSKKIPILTKKELLKFSSEIQSNKSFKKVFLASTSGTSGQSLKFYRNEHADSFNRAAIQRGYSWHNVKIWKRNGYFWGFNFSYLDRIKNVFFDFLQNRYRIFSYKEKELKHFIKKSKRASYIHGYSSMIYQTAVLINKLKLPKPSSLKMIKGTSEKIFDSYQAEIKEAFGLKMISEYGATESGIIAYECKQGNMHVNMEGVFVEEVNNEILVTNLQMHSFPIIRYKLGDYISLASKETKCSCKMQHLIIEEVTGRVGNNVYGTNNIYPSLYFYYIFKNLSKKESIHLNYQVIQNKKGSLDFLLDRKINDLEKKKLIVEIEKYFNSDMSFKIIEEVNFVYQKGKLKNFISRVNE
jgi:phenylacetate-CoA ligase